MKRPLEYLAGGFVLGEVLALLPVGWMAGILAVLTAGVCCLRKRNGRSLVWWLLPIFCGWGILWYKGDLQNIHEFEKTAQSVAGSKIWAEGSLKGIQKQKEGDGLVLELGDVVLLDRGTEREYGSILVYVDKEVLHIGERICVSGRLERFDRPGNPGEFDTAGYYHAMGIEGRLFGEKLQRKNQGYSPYLDGIYRAKCRGAKVLEQICTDEDSGILKAMVLGEKTGLSADLKKLYQNSGISHLLAISGLHISMIGLGCYGLLRKMGLGFRISGAAGVGITVTYGIMAGGIGISAGVSRAVLMVLMQMWADRLGRTYDMRTAVSLSGWLLLLKSPQLLFQAGFQLSFGAVLALGIVLPVVQRWIGVQKGWQKTLLAGAVIQLATCPVVAYHYYEYPVYGILLNLVVLPLMPCVLLSGILGAVFGAAEIKAGITAVGTGHYVLEFYRWLCGKVQNLPGALVVTGQPELWQIGVYGALWCGFLTVMAVSGPGKKERGKEENEVEEGRILPENVQRRTGTGTRSRAGGAAVFAAISVWLLLLRIPVRGMEVTFLDVGQGDGICIRTEELTVLVDGGSTDRKALGTQVLEPFLKSRGISKVDYAIVSHGDQDHISGLMELLEENCGIEIRCVVLPWLGQGEEEVYKKIERAARARKAAVAWMRRGDRIRAGNMEIRCLYAGREEYGQKENQDRNDHSLMLKAEYGPAGILLTGDMSAKGEKEWLSKGETPGIQVLKVAHHGSSYSTGEDFLERINPFWAVISCGEGNRYGHPGEDTIKRLEKQGVRWYATMNTGAVTVETDGERMEVTPFIPGTGNPKGYEIS